MTWQVLGDAETLRDAVQKLDQHLDFRIDHRVHVFELTIRALGRPSFLQRSQYYLYPVSLSISVMFL